MNSRKSINFCRFIILQLVLLGFLDTLLFSQAALSQTTSGVSRGSKELPPTENGKICNYECYYDVTYNGNVHQTVTRISTVCDQRYNINHYCPHSGRTATDILHQSDYWSQNYQSRAQDDSLDKNNKDDRLGKWTLECGFDVTIDGVTYQIVTGDTSGIVIKDPEDLNAHWGCQGSITNALLRLPVTRQGFWGLDCGNTSTYGAYKSDPGDGGTPTPLNTAIILIK